MDSKPSMHTNEDILKRIREIEDKKKSLLEEIKEFRKKEFELAKEAGIVTNTKPKRPRIKKEVKEDWNTENESTPTPEPKSALSPEEQEAREKLIETIARKHKGELTKDELEFYFENRDAIYEAMNRQSDEEFGIKAPETSAPKEEEVEEMEKTKPMEPEPTAPKTKEQTETEFELARRLYFEYSTGSAKFKKESELFKEHALEKEKAYKEAKKSIYQQLISEGKINEAKEFIIKEVELYREHEIKHGPLWTKLKGSASQKIEAWDKWGVDKEGADWNEKLSNWNKRIIKRAINISFIGLTSSGIVAGLAEKGIGSATALAGGTFSRLGAKLGWGVTLGTFTEYLITKISPNVDAEKAQKVLKATLIGAGALGATYVAVTGVSLVGLGVGASAAIGYGISKYTEKKGWTEKSIKEKKENAKNKFNVSNLDDLDKYEKEYLEILKQAENSRVYRKLASTLAAVAGSTTSLEMIGYTRDNNEEITQVYGNSFKNFWSGVKKWWAKPWFDEEKDSKAIHVNPDHRVPEKISTPEPSHQKEIPKKPDGITESEPKHSEENITDKKIHENHDQENNKIKHHVGKKDYSRVRKTWMNSTGGNDNYEDHKISNNYGAKVGYTEVSGVRNYPDRNENGQYLGYKDYTNQNSARYENHNYNQTHKVEIPERITNEEMADRIYSKNLNMILNTPESRTIWENIKDDQNQTDINSFLAIDRDNLGSVQIKNLQDYIEKVIDVTKLKPKDHESIEEFLSRAFDKASSRPKMLEKLQL